MEIEFGMQQQHQSIFERGKSLLIKLMDQDLLQLGTKVSESGLKTTLFS